MLGKYSPLRTYHPNLPVSVVEEALENLSSPPSGGIKHVKYHQKGLEKQAMKRENLPKKTHAILDSLVNSKSSLNYFLIIRKH
jgi:hypothetical protein